MGNPVLGIGTDVLFKIEALPGVREVLTSGAMHIDLISESLDYDPVLSNYPAIAGNRQKWSTAEFVSHNNGGGAITLRPRSAQMETILEIALGKAATTTWVPIVDDSVDLPKFTVEATKAGQTALALVGCKVNTATFKSSVNEPLEVELDILASSGVRNSSNTAWVSTQVDAETPFMHGGLVMSGAEAWLDDSLSAGNVEVRSIEFTLNNNLDAEAYCNSTDRRLIPLGLFTLEGSMEIPYNATTKGFWAERIAAVKVKFTATWTDANANTLSAAFVVKLDGELPKISGPEEQWLKLNFHGVVDLVDPYCIIMSSVE